MRPSTPIVVRNADASKHAHLEDVSHFGLGVGW
jgi:hypothetical protein